MICPPQHGRKCIQRFPNELVEDCRVEPLRGTKPAVKLRLAGNDAEHSHTAAVRRETTKHAIADRLPIFGGVEVLEVETLFKDVVLDVQEALQVSERAPHEHPSQHEMARAGVPKVEVPGLIDVQVERVPRMFGCRVHGRASVTAVKRQGEIDNGRARADSANGESRVSGSVSRCSSRRRGAGPDARRAVQPYREA